MTTLADLTPEERANCPGMWATSFIGYTGVIVYQNGRQAYLIIPEYNREQTFPLDEVTPRPDLPRAWTPDGQPVPGEWEDGHVVVSYDDPDPWILKDAVSIEGLSEGGMSYYDDPPNGIEVKLDKFGEGEGKARRWVGSWEQA